VIRAMLHHQKTRILPRNEHHQRLARERLERSRRLVLHHRQPVSWRKVRSRVRFQ